MCCKTVQTHNLCKIDTFNIKPSIFSIVSHLLLVGQTHQLNMEFVYHKSVMFYSIGSGLVSGVRGDEIQFWNFISKNVKIYLINTN